MLRNKGGLVGVMRFGVATLLLTLAAYSRLAMADPGDAAVTGPRIALLIGNVDYKSEPSLKAVEKDVADMKRVLERTLGFRVETRMNLDRNALFALANETIPQMAAQAKGGVFLLYYSGHGFSYRNEGLLLPVDGVVASEATVEAQTIPVAKLLQPLTEAANAGPLFNLVILDTCRSAPFTKSPAFGKGSMSVGTANLTPPSGTLMVSATQPGNVASPQGPTGNSLYTGELLRYINQPGASIARILAEAARSVKQLSHDAQIPWVEGDPSLGLAVLRASDAVTPQLAAAPAPVAPTAPAPHPAAPTMAAYVPPPQIGELRPPSYLIAPPNTPTADDPAPESAPESAAVPVPPPNPVVWPDTATPGKRFRDCPDCPEMIWLPPGELQPANYTPVTNDGWTGRETGHHAIRLDAPLAVAQSPITRAEYAAFAAGPGIRFGDAWRRPGFLQSESDPVTNVSSDAAEAYTLWLSQRSGGKKYRLIRAGELAYAARPVLNLASADSDLVSKGHPPYCADCGAGHGGRGGGDHAGDPESPVAVANPFGLAGLNAGLPQWVIVCLHHDADSEHNCSPRILLNGHLTAGPTASAGRWTDDDGAEARSGAGFRVVRPES